MVEKYSDKVKSWGEGCAMVEQASRVLQEELGSHAEHASVDWEQTKDENGQPVYTLAIRDLPDEAKTKLTPDDFQDATLLRLRLSSVWRELLRVRTNRIWSEYKEANDLGGKEWPKP